MAQQPSTSYNPLTLPSLWQAFTSPYYPTYFAGSGGGSYQEQMQAQQRAANYLLQQQQQESQLAAQRQQQADELARRQAEQALRIQSGQFALQQQAQAAQLADMAARLAMSQQAQQFNIGALERLGAQQQQLFEATMPQLQHLFPRVTSGMDLVLDILRRLPSLGGETPGGGVPGTADTTLTTRLLGPLMRRQEAERQEFESRIAGAGRQAESPVFQAPRTLMEQGQQEVLAAEAVKAALAERGLDLETIRTVTAALPNLTGAYAPFLNILQQLFGARTTLG